MFHSQHSYKHPAQVLALDDGSPLYYALLDEPEDGVMGKDLVQAAKSNLDQAIEIDEDRVRALSGVTHEQARLTLNEILGKDLN